MNDTSKSDDSLPGAGTPRARREEFLIVGIGASAGGVQALQSFFAEVQSNSGMAYVVVLHLSPDHESRLAEILQSSVALPVTQVRERTRVEPDHVYVIPPHQSLAMDDGHLVLSDATGIAERRAPIDIFFRTLAESHHTRAVCVVLSGTGADGSMGLKRVKEDGGICIVQDPGEAAYGDMPRHAIATNLVDEVLPVAAIPAKIAAYKRYREIVEIPAEEASEADEQALRDIYTRLRVSTGHDFTNYKRATVLRRIARRMNVHELTTVSAYAARLHEEPDEVQALLKDLLISVTNFFRDPEAFAVLERDVIPLLFANRTKDEAVRVWVAGCATGEEAYSVAMLLAEHALESASPPQLQIFATDIDEWALGKARAGFYTINDAADVSPERLRRFFTKDGNGFRVSTALRETVVFAVHNVIKHPAFSRLDLITCRNLLIYLDATAQRRLIDVFHFALKPGAYLFLGASESLDASGNLFNPVDKDAHVFRSASVHPRPPPPFSSMALPPMRVHTRGEPRHEDAVQARLTYQELHQRLLEQYAPPSVVVNEEHQVVHLSEGVGRYLQVAGGEPSNDLLRMVRAELRLDLRTALYQAVSKRRSAEARGLRVNIAGAVELVNIHVRPVLREDDAARGFLLVIFETADPALQAPAPEKTAAEGSEPIARQLEDELMRVKAQLHGSAEQHELHEEELRASNEELQSMNEELHSASEELETGREELQSMNEELTTVNQELKVKIDELTQAGNDARNLMNSTDIATVFLDRRLRVKLFTPRAKELFNLIATDAGRPLLDITHKLQYDDLVSDIERVLDTLQPVEREVASREHRWYIAGVAPYRTADDRIDGVVLTCTEITARKRAEDSLRATEEQFRRSIEDAPIPVIMHAEDGEVLEISRPWTEYTGYALRDVPTLEAWLTRASGEGAQALRNHLRDLFSGVRPRFDVELTIYTQANVARHWSFSVSSPGRLSDGRRFAVGMAVDVTERRQSEEALRRSEERVRLILESVHDYAIFTTDLEGKIETWNPGAERIFEYSEAEAIGLNAQVIFTPEDRARCAPEEEMHVARETGHAADERWHIRKSGERFFASGVLTPLRDDHALIGYTKIAQDLTEKREADENLKQAHEHLEVRVHERTRELAEANESLRLEVIERKQSEEMRVRLLGLLVEAQENERRRIARELHDQLGQQVTALALKLAALKVSRALPAKLQPEVQHLEAIAKELDGDVDFLVWELRPTALDDLGLFDALTEYIATWSKHFGVPARFAAPGMDSCRLTTEVDTVLYRVTQEALNNVAKHANAGHVEILLECGDDDVSLIVRDDGVGFDPEQPFGAGAKGLGLVGIRERIVLAGGKVTFESKPGKGVAIFVRIPLPANGRSPPPPPPTRGE